MKKEYDLKKLKVKRRGALIKKETKVMKTLRLDSDILKWLMKESELRGLGYQTLVNLLLRERMQQASSISRELESEIRKLIRDEMKKA